MTAAASIEALVIQLTVAAHMGVPLLHSPGHRPGWWPDHFEPGCNHVGDGPVFAHLASPSVIRCAACSLAYTRAAVEVDPDLCDLCRQPSPGHRFRETLIRAGRVMVFGNLCRACFETGALEGDR